MSVYHPTKLPFEITLLDEVGALMRGAKKVIIICHKGPDGDAIGSSLAIKHALKQWDIEAVSACIDPPPEYALILPGSYEFVNDFDLTQFDLAIAVDCGDKCLMKFDETKPELLDGKIPLINIDHHPSNDNFGTHNLVHDTAAAASFTIYHLLKYLNFQITHDIANCLMMGLYYDTGSFMHSNTTRDVLEVASDLMNCGARIQSMVKTMFRTTPVSRLKLWGRVMDRARLTPKKAVISAVTEQDFVECDAHPNDTGGVIDYLNAVPEAKFSILLSENQRGTIKGSLRTQHDDVDLSKIASLFGGGGHKKAAGFTVPGRLEPEIHWKIRAE